MTSNGYKVFEFLRLSDDVIIYDVTIEFYAEINQKSYLETVYLGSIGYQSENGVIWGM